MKINTYEKIVMNLLNENIESFQTVWTRFLDYYAAKDALENSNHVSFIHAIYAKEQPRALKHVALPLELHVSERSLYRYRKQYLKCLALMARQLDFPLNLHN